MRPILAWTLMRCRWLPRGQGFHNPENSLLIITHHQSLLEHIAADCVHFLVEGRIVESGGKELLAHVEESGFAAYR